MRAQSLISWKYESPSWKQHKQRRNLSLLNWIFFNAFYDVRTTKWGPLNKCLFIQIECQFKNIMHHTWNVFFFLVTLKIRCSQNLKKKIVNNYTYQPWVKNGLIHSLSYIGMPLTYLCHSLYIFWGIHNILKMLNVLNYLLMAMHMKLFTQVLPYMCLRHR